MRFEEFKNELPFDLADDVYVFMKNDPEFYRNEYFPALCKCCDDHKAGGYDIKKTMFPIVDRAFESYREKFKMPKHQYKLFDQSCKDSIVDMITNEESSCIERGDYE